MSHSTCDLLGIGLSVFDNSLFVKTHPGEDEKIEAQRCLQSLGGPACVGTLTANRLGLQTTLLSAVADDFAGDFIKKSQAQFSRHTFIPLKTDITPQATILIKENGERSVIATLAKNTKATQVNLLDVPKYILLDGRYIDTCFDLIMHFRKLGSEIILDAGSRNPGILTMLPYADIIIGSKKFALSYTKKTNIDEALDKLRGDFDNVLITLGDQGAIYSFEQSQGRISCEKINAVNTNGAGDVFHGAFIAGLAKGLKFLECSQFASRIASWHCTQISIESTLNQLGKNRSLKSFL
jgi:sulfofructose kinase